MAVPSRSRYAREREFSAIQPQVTIRRATVDDAAGIAEIYNAEVLNSTSTMDMVPRTIEEQRDGSNAAQEHSAQSWRAMKQPVKWSDSLSRNTKNALPTRRPSKTQSTSHAIIMVAVRPTIVVCICDTAATEDFTASLPESKQVVKACSLTPLRWFRASRHRAQVAGNSTDGLMLR